MIELCSKCNINPIHVKKRKLCSVCYQRWFSKQRRKGKYKNIPIRERRILNTAEIDFSKDFFDHKNWIYQPATFRFNSDIYQPDFYDGERNIFIEVIGTRQTFDNNKEKYKKFIEIYPKINFEIRHANGDLIDINAERQKWE